MCNLNYFFLKKQYNRLETNPYVTHNLLNLIDRIKNYYFDDELEIIYKCIDDNILLEDSDKRPNIESIKIINNCIYELDEWVFKNKDKLEKILDKL